MDNLTGWHTPSAERMRAFQNAQRALGPWPAATLANHSVAIESALRQLTLTTLADAAALRAHYNR